MVDQQPFIPESDVDLLEFPLNLEYLEAKLFLWATRGYGLDKVAPNLTMGGPPPIGARRANLDGQTSDIINMFATQEGTPEAGSWIPKAIVGSEPNCIAGMMNMAFEERLEPPFDPYANSTNFLHASYLIPYVALTGNVGMTPHLKGLLSRSLAAGLLGSVSAQDAVIREMMYEQASREVEPYGMTVAEFTNRISELRNRLGGAGMKDKGIALPGSRKRRPGSLLAGDRSISFDRSAREILRIMYGKESEHVPGGFFPQGANGRIARSLLRNAWSTA
ncbi:hypothetical protein ACLOJK_009727 [Asimina triloba]